MGYEASPDVVAAGTCEVVDALVDLLGDLECDEEVDSDALAEACEDPDAAAVDSTAVALAEAPEVGAGVSGGWDEGWDVNVVATRLSCSTNSPSCPPLATVAPNRANRTRTLVNLIARMTLVSQGQVLLVEASEWLQRKAARRERWQQHSSSNGSRFAGW